MEWFMLIPVLLLLAIMIIGLCMTIQTPVCKHGTTIGYSCKWCDGAPWYGDE